MSKRLSSILQYIIFFGGGIFLIWRQFHLMTPVQVQQFKFALSAADYRILIPVIIMSLSAHLIRSLRWQILIEPLGYKTHTANVFGVTMVGYLVNSFVPRLGEIIKCTMLGKYENIPPQKLIGTILLERIFDIICYIGFILFNILIQYKLVTGFVKNTIAGMANNQITLPWWGGAIICIWVGLIVFIIWRLKKYPGHKFAVMIKNFIKGVSEGFSGIKKLKKRKTFLLYTVCIWSLYILQIYVAFFSIKELSHLNIGAACSVLTLATLAMILTPGGIGTFPTAIFLVLQLYKIQGTVSIAFGWLMWGATTFIVLFFGSICLLALLYFHRHRAIKYAAESSDE